MKHIRTARRLKELGYSKAYNPQYWALLDYKICIVWLESTQALVLSPSERQWLYKPDEESIWNKNFALYAEILKVPFNVSEQSLTDIFDLIVCRVIEEKYTNSDTRHRLITRRKKKGPELDSVSVDTGIVDFCKHVARTDAPLDVGDVYAILRCCFTKNERSNEELVPWQEVARHVGRLEIQKILSIVNQTISSMQEITADVSTDHRQARVGF